MAKFPHYENTDAMVLAKLGEFIAYSPEFDLCLFVLHTLGSMRNGNNLESDFLHMPGFVYTC